jgi:thiol-disulfide isomerase/thioredoxin
MLKYLIPVILFFALLNNTFAQEFLPANQITLDSLKEVYKGKVILVNFWATWCKPCTEEFPDIMKINSEYKDKDFKLIFVSLDFGKDLEEQTQKFLNKMGVEFTTYFNAFKNDEDLINYMDKKWQGSIPGTFIFDKNGKLRKTYIGKTDYSDFKKSVEKYIK